MSLRIITTAEAQNQSRRSRSKALPVAWAAALAVECAHCGAKPGALCNRVRVRGRPHAVRVREATS